MRAHYHGSAKGKEVKDRGNVARRRGIDKRNREKDALYETRGRLQRAGDAQSLPRGECAYAWVEAVVAALPEAQRGS